MRAGTVVAAGIFLFSPSASAQTVSPDETFHQISLSVPSGAPLRLYLAKRISKRVGAPVEAKLLESVFAFDREVLPIGTVALGQVSRVQPVGKWQRARAIVNGDFTPLRQAEVEFTTLLLPDGRELTTHTIETAGLNSIYTEPSNKPSKKKSQKTQPPNQNGGILGTVRQTAKDRINGAINARSRGIADIVRGPNKKEKLVDFLWSKLPYHPQYVRRGTRFDASLRDPLGFGFVAVKPGELAALGSQPLPDSVVHARLLTALDSASAKLGQEVKAVVNAPLFSPDHKLVYPQGTLLTGTVVLAKKARSFHRPGQLRFNFQKIELPQEVANMRPAAPAPLTTQATLAAAEAGGTAPIKVDSEGGVQAKESKTRFIAPVISLMLASRAADNDAGHHHDAGAGGADGNVSGRTLGGGSGFGMLGAAVSQSSRYVGMAFGYYGLAWSVYSSVIARGGEVQFDKNAVMDIRFGARTPPPGSKYRSTDTGAQ
jgi:hypothetical protein